MKSYGRHPLLPPSPRHDAVHVHPGYLLLYEQSQPPHRQRVAAVVTHCLFRVVVVGTGGAESVSPFDGFWLLF